MMDLRAMGDLVASLFGMLNKKTYILFRLDFLVVFVTILFLIMFVMDIFRRGFHSTIMTTIFNLSNGVSDSVLIYLMGATQTAAIKNELFPVWTLVLIMFRYSIGFISAYGVPDTAGRWIMEVRSLTNLATTAFLNLKYASRFQLPVWLLLALQILSSFYRFISYFLVTIVNWLGWSSEVISEYMRADHDPSKWKPEDCNPETMQGYKYLIHGEAIKIEKPRYVMRIFNDPSVYPDIKGSSLVTLERVWQCWSHLGAGHDPNDCQAWKDIGDLSLAFALSRLLRCRLEDVNLPENIHHINRELVKKRIIEERDYKRAFRIMELQLAFVNDYLNTRYPMIFPLGLLSLFFSLLHSVMTAGVVCWLSVDIIAHMLHSSNKVDMIITLAFMLFVMFKEIWEMVVYLLSDWTRLLLVCMYVRMGSNNDDERGKNSCFKRIILRFFRCKIGSRRWHSLLDQYFFLLSYDDKPTFWNLLHRVTTGMIPKNVDCWFNSI